MVTSFDPLVIYTFSDFYLRVCGSDFTLEDISDPYKHLSNYSIQKTNKNGQAAGNRDEELTMSQAQFVQYLKENGNDPK
jgi:hypothetical protein